MSAEDITKSATTIATFITAFVAALIVLSKKLRELKNSVSELQAGMFAAKQDVTILQQQPSATTGTQLPKPTKPDPLLVIQWAQDPKHRAANPWDMGPKNWERCLYDLNYAGGVNHQLHPDQNGNLPYE